MLQWVTHCRPWCWIERGPWPPWVPVMALEWVQVLGIPACMLAGGGGLITGGWVGACIT